MNNLSDPSTAWNTWIRDLQFLQHISTDDLRLHVGFGYYLGSPIEKDLWAAAIHARSPKNSASQRLFSDFERLRNGLKAQYWLSEPDPLRHRIAVPYSQNGIDYWLNRDTLRTQVDLGNLVRCGLLEGTRRHYVEIGGGYGRLAHAVLTCHVDATYTIVNFPFMLDIVKRWIEYVAPNIQVVTDVDDFDSMLGRPKLRLVSNTQVHDLGTHDVLINVNSFSEMRTDQVLHYLNANTISTTFIYSNNRDNQINTQQLEVALTSLLASAGILWPDPQFYDIAPGHPDLGRSDTVKKIFVVNRSRESWAPNIVPNDLAGVNEAYMPGV